MTTIAYRSGVIAADGRAVEGNLIVSDRQWKIGRIAGLLYGACGDCSYGWRFRSWVRGGAVGDVPLPESGSAAGFVAMPNGQIFSAIKEGPELLRVPFYTIGSGAPFAHAAMRGGATAEEAVRLAARCDINTGGRIVVLRR